MTEPDTEIQRATKNAGRLALSIGVRVFLYRDLAGKPVIRAIHPADRSEHLELIAEFEPPPRTIYDGLLPPTPTPAS